MNEVLNSKERWEGACVIDDVLYFHDRSGEKAFDPKQSRWSAVNGLEEFLAVEVTDVVQSGEVWGEEVGSLFP